MRFFSGFIILTRISSAVRSMNAQSWIRNSFQCFDREWVASLQGSTPLYDEPVFFNVPPNNYFHEKITNGWMAGVALSPKQPFPFLINQAEKLCDRSKQILKSPFTSSPYQLMMDSFRKAPKITSNVEAMYMKKDENYLQLVSMGKWWGGLYRRGKLMRSISTTRENSVFSLYNKEIGFTANFSIESNDLLVITRADYGQKNEDIISISIESGEENAVSLQQMANNLSPSLLHSDPGSDKPILVLSRMVPSEDQVSEL